MYIAGTWSWPWPCRGETLHRCHCFRWKQVAFHSLTQQRCCLSPLFFSLINIYFCAQGKKKTPVFSCFSLCCRHSLTFDGAHACWIWDFSCFQTSWGYWGQGDERWPFPWGRSAQSAVSFAEVCKAQRAVARYCVRGRRVDAGEQRGPWTRQEKSSSRTQLVYEALWALLVSTGLCDVFLERKEILYGKLKWSDVPCSQEKSSFSTDLTRCCAMWWIDTIH